MTEIPYKCRAKNYNSLDKFEVIFQCFECSMKMTAIPDVSLAYRKQQAEEPKADYKFTRNAQIPSFIELKPQIIPVLPHAKWIILLETLVYFSQYSASIAEGKPLGWTACDGTKPSKSIFHCYETDPKCKHTQKPEQEVETLEELQELVKDFKSFEAFGVIREEIRNQAMRRVEIRYDIGPYWRDENCTLLNKNSTALKCLKATEARLRQLGTVQRANDHQRLLREQGFLRETSHVDLNPPVAHERVYYVIGFLTFNRIKQPTKPRLVVDTTYKYELIVKQLLDFSSEDYLTSRKVPDLSWDAKKDVFKFKMTHNLELLTLSLENDYHPTKRKILSFVIKISVCLGMISHFVIRGRMIWKSFWRRGIAWEQHIPDDIQETWQKWPKNFEEFQKLEISRYYGYISTKASNISLHIFVDASTKAYKAVAYFCFKLRTATTPSFQRIQQFESEKTVKVTERTQQKQNLKSLEELFLNNYLEVFKLEIMANLGINVCIKLLSQLGDAKFAPRKDIRSKKAKNEKMLRELMRGDIWEDKKGQRTVRIHRVPSDCCFMQLITSISTHGWKIARLIVDDKSQIDGYFANLIFFDKKHMREAMEAGCIRIGNKECVIKQAVGPKRSLSFKSFEFSYIKWSFDKSEDDNMILIGRCMNKPSRTRSVPVLANKWLYDYHQYASSIRGISPAARVEQQSDEVDMEIDSYEEIVDAGKSTSERLSSGKNNLNPQASTSTNDPGDKKLRSIVVIPEQKDGKSTRKVMWNSKDVNVRQTSDRKVFWMPAPKKSAKKNVRRQSKDKL